MDPQVPEISVQENPIPEPVKKSNGITIASVALFILMSLGVIFFLYNQNQQLKAMLASYQTPIASPTPVATIDPTANWKTYTNTKLGFSFRYPQSSIIKTDLINTNGTLEFNNFIFSVEKTKDTLTDYVAKLKDINGALPVSKMTGSIPTIEWIGSFKNEPAHYLSFEKEGYVYSFGIVSLEDVTTFNSTNTNLLSQILSTFKFISPVSSSTPVPVGSSSGVPIIKY